MKNGITSEHQKDIKDTPLDQIYSKKLKKWSLARNQNVKFIYSLWRKNPERVELLEDQDFKEEPLVMMRKEYLEKILKQNKNLILQLSKLENQK